MDTRNQLDLLEKHWPSPSPLWQQAWLQAPRLKRSVDLGVAGLLVILLSPLLLAIATLVVTTSRGGCFYRGLRTGRHARPFRIFKFRTMVAGAENLGGSTTGKNDARVTAVGHVLRKFKLDELPQLLNVLSGEMSLVGPRPEVYEYTTRFTEAEQVILALRPGITDLSSLHFINLQAHVGEADPDEVFRNSILPVKNQLRVHYVRHHSIALDLRILWATCLKLIFPTVSTAWVQEQFPVNHSTGPVGCSPHATNSELTTPLTSPPLTGRLAMGCWAVGGHGWGEVDDRESIAAIRSAWEQGVTHFDTADVYGLGHSEKILSEALGAHRHDAVIATKFGVRINPNRSPQYDLSRNYCRVAVENSLRRLRLDSLPILYAHWPDGKTSPEQLMTTLMELRDEGKIQSIGLSNFSSAEIRKAQKIGPVHFVQFEFSLLNHQSWADFAWLNSQTETTVVTWGSLAKGLLANKFQRETEFPASDSRSRDPMFQGLQFAQHLKTAKRVAEVAQQLNLLPVQVALLVVLRTWSPGCALFGAKTPQQVRENVTALAASLPENDYDMLCRVAGFFKEQRQQRGTAA